MSDAGDKESSVHEGHPEMPSRTAAPSQASTMMPTSYDKNTCALGDGQCIICMCFFCVYTIIFNINIFFSHTADVLVVPPVLSLPPPVAHVRTSGGKALFENLYIPPLPPGVKPLNSFASLQSSTQDIQADSRVTNAKYVAYCFLRPGQTHATFQRTS